MISLFDRDTLLDARALLRLEPDLQHLIRRRIDDAMERDLIDLTHIVLMQQNDGEIDLLREIACSPLQGDGARFPSEDFIAPFDGVEWAPEGAWVIVTCVADSGFAYLVIIPDQEDIDLGLLELCRAYAPH